ncbi:diguanylate cyclase (GGDEF)-like protein [Methylohalomonas lacus]|uniref:diguanylate cyclase n=1 Tax=Methylohalomonas lacus TaxID=398773 RepID=A0AAE3HI99_9GAMM|nr:GGDEF domain-containing protein [Methylohalomonas lacus]MCS3902809.1 diguanylate cyclase (GGDEF)-like protein [Methylohalomonas lacus]
MLRALPGQLAAALPYALLLALPAWLVNHVARIPAGLQLFVDNLPLLLSGICVLLAFGFHRGRTLVVALAAGLAYWGMSLAEAVSDNRGVLLFSLAQLALCLNLTLFAFVRERGMLSKFGLTRLGFIALQVAVIAGLVALDSSLLAAVLELQLVDIVWLERLYIPQVILLLLLPALVILIVRNLLQPGATHAAFLAAFLAVVFAAFRPDLPYWDSFYMSAALVILTFGLLQDSYRMAFRDELTGLPARRAMQHKLNTLGNEYAIAMLDVDHFKKFNDTHGHEVGDQVLKMVASHLGAVTGGGTAYRYGGEEFTIIFPRRNIKQCIPHLSKVRENIENYTLVLRRRERPRKAEKGRRQRGRNPPTKRVSVTISIGVAERNQKWTTPRDVMEAADKALYRAKEKGRNQISR